MLLFLWIHRHTGVNATKGGMVAENFPKTNRRRWPPEEFISRRDTKSGRRCVEN